MDVTRFFLILCFCVFGAAGQLSARGHVRSQGETSMDAWVAFYRASERFDEDGQRVPDFKFSMNEFRLYAEHGLTRHDTVLANLIFMDVNAGEAAGFQECHLGWKRALWGQLEGPHAVSAHALFIAPGGGQTVPSFRLGKWGGELALLYSFNAETWDFDWFIDLTGAVRWYFGSPSDELRAEWRSGIYVLEWLQLRGGADLEWGLKNGQNVINGGYLANSQHRLLRMIGQVRARINSQLHFDVYYFKHVWGENIGANGGWGVGVRGSF